MSGTILETKTGQYSFFFFFCSILQQSLVALEAFNYLLKFWDFPTLSEILQYKPWLPEELFTFISQEGDDKSLWNPFPWLSLIPFCPTGESSRTSRQHVLKLGFPEPERERERERETWVCQLLSHVGLCMDCSPPGFSVRGILQTRMLEWVAILFSRTSSRSKDWTRISCIAGRFFTIWATREAQRVAAKWFFWHLNPGLHPNYL